MVQEVLLVSLDLSPMYFPTGAWINIQKLSRLFLPHILVSLGSGVVITPTLLALSWGPWKEQVQRGCSHSTVVLGTSF